MRFHLLRHLLRSWLAVLLSVSLVLMFGEIIPSAVFTGSEQLTMASRFAGLVSPVAKSPRLEAILYIYTVYKQYI